MNRISGKILLKESGVGIPDLLVVVYDVDPNTQPEETIRSSAGGINAPLVALGQGFPGDRLGSVLTGANGAFELTYENSEFQIRNKEEKRPDLFLMVVAPEELGGDLNASILFTSAAIRQNAGQTEEYLIRLTTAQLEKVGVSIPAAESPTPEEPEQVIARLAKIQEQQAKLSAGLQAINTTRIENVRARTRDFEGRLKPQLLKVLSNVSEKLKQADTFVAPDQSVTEKNFKNIRSRIEKVINVADNPNVRAPVVGRVRLSGAQKQKLQAFQTANGDFVNVPDEMIEPILFGPAGANERKTLLLRENPLSRLCHEKTAGEKCLDDEEEGPDGSDGNGGGETPGSEVEVVTENDVPRYIARLIDKMTAPEDPIAFGGIVPGKRADQEDVQKRIDALSFRRSPADVPAFYDFHHLQIAFEHVWQEAVDQGVLGLTEDAYKKIVELGGDPCLDPFNVIPGAVVDYIDCFRQEFEAIEQARLEDPNVWVVQAFDVTREQWSVLNDELQGELERLAMSLLANNPNLSNGHEWRNRWRQQGERILRYADNLLTDGANSFDQLHHILTELEQRLHQPYAFTTYAANRYERSVNFGILITYRQKWEPTTYQAGELVKTVTLAPKEVRKFSKKVVMKRSQAQKEVEDSLISRKEESSLTSRIETEIVRNAQAKTNFSLATEGNYNIGISEGKQTSTFGGDASKTSNEVKKEIRDAVHKESLDYTNNRKVELSVEESLEEEFMESGEIMNPNDELPVTFLFYELQRRYKVSEHIHRILPVILVAQEVPAPHEIDEEWVIAHDWILRRFLLDDSFRPALNYLSTRVVGDEFALKEMRKNVEQQRKLIEEIKEEVIAYRELVGQRYAALERAVERSARAAEDEGGGGLLGSIGNIVEAGVEFLTGEGDESPEAARIRERAARDAYEKAAQEERDLMARLNREVTALNAITETYTKALSEHLNHRTQISRFLVHLKENILYYMQGIWLMEPDDQRFFRLHQVEVPVFEKKSKFYAIKGQPTFNTFLNPALPNMKVHEYTVNTEIDPDFKTVPLVEVADLDNLLGFKGNYMLFPLKKSNPLTDFMLAPYLDQEWELYDPDVFGNMTLDEFSDYVCCLKKEMPPADFEAAKPELKELLKQLLTSPLRDQEEIIVPTDSLFIETLPGVHPILEDFKLIHRIEDVKKVQEEVREMALENIRLAARLLAGEREDPDIDKKIIVEGEGTNLLVTPEDV